jgi:hypothetical protein
MRKRLSYANVVSTLALFGVIAGGTAIALPGKGSVKSNDIKKNAVKAAAIAKAAVGSSEIADGSVGGAEIADGSVGGAEVADRGLGYEDLGSNSVVARIRSTGSINSGDGGQASPVAIPLSGRSWTQAANEIDVGFGEATYTEPPVCGNNGSLVVEVLIDGQPVNDESLNDAAPGQTLTEPLLRSRPYLFEPGADTARSVTMRAYDTCSGAGENYTLRSVAANVIGTR